MKNNIDVFYFACVVPMHVFFAEDGNMEKKVFLATWKDIPSSNEVQFTLENIECNAGEFLILGFCIRKATIFCASSTFRAATLCYDYVKELGQVP